MGNIPLTPSSGGGVCIDLQALRPADIIVSTGEEFVSTVIKIGTASAVSHASLYAGGGKVIEAVGDDKGGVRNVPLLAALEGHNLAVAYRHLQMTPDVASKIVKFAQDQVGRHYDTEGAAEAGLRTASGFGLCVVLVGVVPCLGARAVMGPTPGKFYCSEFVLAAYKAGGLSVINGDPASSVPNDVVMAYSHGILGYVGHLIA